MAKYKRRPVIIEAHQWFKNGDHPQDDTFPVDADGECFQSEGKIVRYYRTPNMDAFEFCRKCNKNIPIHSHGWVDTLEGGHIVCPGDWIITGIAGEHYPVKPHLFIELYEEISE